MDRNTFLENGQGRNTNDPETFSFSLFWNGSLSGGVDAPNGQYRLALRSLRMLASNVDNADSWDTFVSPVFTVQR